MGYALGDLGLIEALSRVKDSFNSYPLDRLAQAGAIASLVDEEHFQRNRTFVIAQRARMADGLIRLGFTVLPSAANFVFARHPAYAGATLAAMLRDRSVVVRHFAKPRIADHLRISVGTGADTDRLLDALTQHLKAR